eukprot:gnl/Dysnectes_brevis/1029_a1147_2885.p1 GENE.gnl/Dysnectes_brevis/1029_a1147_2885~~gnl/Dysnectes_brevis/1029_a1147_2885.p1  ORF type:complete len:276 (-),score=59.83 gnl/Dysnectes_brevis/1029_a1147_2885:403-1173(-)
MIRNDIIPTGSASFTDVEFIIKKTKLKARGTLYINSDSLSFRCSEWSFLVPLRNIEGAKVEQPVFGAPCVSGQCFPIVDGGLMGQMKFKASFHDESKYTQFLRRWIPNYSREKVKGHLSQFVRAPPAVQAQPAPVAYMDASQQSRVYVPVQQAPVARPPMQQPMQQPMQRQMAPQPQYVPQPMPQQYAQPMQQQPPQYTQPPMQQHPLQQQPQYAQPMPPQPQYAQEQGMMYSSRQQTAPTAPTAPFADSVDNLQF